MWAELSDVAIMKNLGSRIKAYRIELGMKQNELAEESGVGLGTIGKIENGQPVSFALIISVLRTMGLLENLELLIPERKISPLQMVKLQGKQVQRVRTSKNQ